MLFLGKFVGKREPRFQDSVVGWLGSATHGIDLLQVSLSLSDSIDPLLCTLHDVARRGGARKRDLSTSENLGSKLNRKCKTCFSVSVYVY
jgi:hypothetical protein